MFKWHIRQPIKSQKPRPFTQRKVWQQCACGVVAEEFNYVFTLLRPLYGGRGKLAAQPINMLIHGIMWLWFYDDLTNLKSDCWCQDPGVLTNAIADTNSLVYRIALNFRCFCGLAILHETDSVTSTSIVPQPV